MFLKVCGGKSAFCNELWNCFDLHPYRPGDDDVCPSNPDFASRWAEVHGLVFDDLPIIRQRPVDLPIYVPHLDHQYSRLQPLEWPIIAVTPYEIFRRTNARYHTVVSDAASLRQFFHLAPRTQIILRGTDVDRSLETYWSHRRIDQAAEQLAALDIALMIAPNFSHFGDATRTDHLFNRKRQLICLQELAIAGVNVVPHLNAAVDADWHFWSDYLYEQTSITTVAKEFQTGNKKQEHGLQCLEQMATIQQRIGRPLHPILIGGAPLTEAAATHFQSFTVLDSRPFQNAVHRHFFEPKGRQQRWISSQRLPGFGVDDFVWHNFEEYSRWIAMRAKTTGGLRFLRDRKTG
jgi:hypothetical protein